MDIQPATILAMVDCIVESTTEDDIKTAVEGIRSLKLDGAKPSILLQKIVVGKPTDHTVMMTSDVLHAKVIELSNQVTALLAENAQLEIQVADLHKQVQKIDNGTEPINGFYTMAQFLAILTCALGRSYGWRTDYIHASQEAPDCKPVATEMIHKWQVTNQVPDWAVSQIARLSFKHRPGARRPAWSDDEEAYLTAQYVTDPSQKNSVLAQSCETHFGRPINENSIKGALDRLRKKGKLPLKRPKRT
jgi:hypothetical protein